MQLLLDVLSSVSIKRKKPWPKLAWIGQEQDGLYLLDGKRISQLYIPSGKTKKKITKLHRLMNDVCAINVSQNGQYLCGALYDGKIFLWERDKDKLQYITGLPKVFNDADKGNTKNKIFLSSSQTVILLMVGFKKLFLWQKSKDPLSGSTEEISGTWCQIHHGEYTLPDQSNKETSVDGVFYTDDVVGNCGALSFVFNKGTDLNVTTLNIKLNDQSTVTNLSHNLPNQDDETVPHEVTENIKCSIKWHSLARPLYGITPATRVVKGKFVYVCRYSPDGHVLAIVLNQKFARDTRLMFYCTFSGTATIVDLKCCGGSEESSGRLWWVSDIAWTQDSLLLLGINRSGALFITSKLGEPINLVTSGCKMDMGPSLFLSLHPRIAVRSFQENIPPNSSEISSGSEKDVFHQKFSVAVHPNFPIFVCSDGYIVTIIQFNDKPAHAEMMTNLIEEISHHLPNSSYHDVSSELKKKPQDVSKTAVAHSIMGTPSENSSAGSTLSGTIPGYGMAKNLEAGMLTFGEALSKARSDVKLEKMTEQQKHFAAKNRLLQALGVGVSCGSHWSNNMPVAMNLVIHAWGKLFWALLEDESTSTALSDKNVPFCNIIKFYQLVLEIFQWDMPYQHCLPWLSQFASSTVKSLVSFKRFGHREVIEVCIKLLRMTESSVNQIYTWRAVSNRSSVHLLGDTFSPLCDAVSTPTTTNTMVPGHQQSVNLETSSDLDFKLERSWVVVYNYVSKIYQRASSAKVDDEKDQFPDQQLLEWLCIIQRKLQEMKSSRNLVLINKMENLFDQGQIMYIEGKRSHAVDLLKKSFEDNTQSMSSHPQTGPLKSSLEIRAKNILETERSNTSADDRLFVQQDLALRLKRDTDTLLAILWINLENYDLKAALALVHSFINTNRPINLQGILNTGSRLEESPPIFPTDDSHGKLTSSSSLIDLQLSTLTRYPLAWVVDNCALPVVQQFAKFMACYFINSPLTIPMPFQSSRHLLAIEELENDELTHSHGSINSKYLSQQKVTDAVAKHKLEAFWTADHAMELLVVSGLLGDAASFAHCLGDWKIAFMLSVTDELHRTVKLKFYQSPFTHLYFSPPVEVIQPKELMLSKIKSILHPQDDLISPAHGDQDSDNNIVPSLQSTFKASLIAGLDLVPVIIKYLMQVLREKISNLEWMVVQDFYLPAPPLYCPQPTRNEEEIAGEEMRKEILLRGEIAKIVQKILAVYRASKCFLLCAQEYCKHVAVQLNDQERDTLPSVIKEFITSNGLHFDANIDNGDGAEPSCSHIEDRPESVVGVLRSFQEFCGLMWFLHARDELALTSRAYSKVKQTLFVGQDEDHKQAVIQKCEDVLTWLKRFLPFSAYLDSTHHILDGMLTLLTELPLTTETVNLLAQYFHNPPPSLGLSTAEKLKRLTRKLRNVSGPLGMGNGEPLSVLFQEKCEVRRKEAKAVPRNPAPEKPVDLETVFEFCDSLAYQKDSAYLRFLDTFILITVSKNVTERDHKKIPLLLPYKNQLELVEISGNEQPNEKPVRTPKVMSHTSLGVKRSQSFQDMKKKTHGALLSSDGDEKNDRSPLHRSNSLTDLRKVEKSMLSGELRAMLPRLIWLRKWCSVKEGHTGNQGGNKSVLLLNRTTYHGAMRVQVSLRMIVNTLWLIENYYKDFVEAKGRCVKDEIASMKRRKRRKRNGGKTKASLKKEEREEGGRRIAEGGGDKGGGRGEGGGEGEGGEEEEEEEEEERGGEEETRRDQQEGKKVKSHDVTKAVMTNVVEKDQPLQRHIRHKKKPRVIAEKKIGEDLKPVFKQYLGQPSILVQDIDSGDTVLETPSTSKIKKNLFSSSSGSIERKWKSSEPVVKELPLLSLSVLDNSPTVSDEKVCSNDPPKLLSYSSQKLIQTTSLDSTGESGALESGQLGLSDESRSLSSESLSVGQIKSDFVSLMKPTPTGNSLLSMQTKPSDSSEGIKVRKPIKRKIREESSSCETSGKVSMKSKDEASLLRRIIRSEMRKFIKSQHAQQKTQSSAVLETTEEDISSKELSSEEQSSVFVRKRRSQEASRMKPSKKEHSTKVPRNKTNSGGTSEERHESCSEPTQELLPKEPGKDAKDAIPTNIVNNQSLGVPAQPLVNEHQAPTIPMNPWPFWYQAPFPVAPPWVWPNPVSKENDDKAVQVESSEVFAEQKSGQEDDGMKVKDRRERDDKESVKRKVDDKQSDSLQHNQIHSKENSDMINDVAVQTHTHAGNIHRRGIKNMVDGSWDDVRETGNRREASEEYSSLGSSKETVIVSGDRPLDPNVQEAKSNGLLCQEEFTIPLLKIPHELRNPPSSMIPFKIAWPEETVDTDIRQPSEMPLLHLDDIKEESDRESFVPFKAPSTSLRLPLLCLSNSCQPDSFLRNFRFLDIPANQSPELPLLHFPETEKYPLALPANVFVEGGKRTSSKMRSRSGDKKPTESVFETKNKSRDEMSNAREKRRRFLKEDAQYSRSSIKPNQRRKLSVPKQTSSESYSSEPRASVSEKTASKIETMEKEKKPSRRRGKLQELNNIIRDLERDLSDESDLVLSEVSELLSQEIKYENFEKKPKFTISDKTIKEETLETSSKVYNKELRRVDLKPSNISRLYKPSEVSARDIHSEFPPSVPVEPSSSDAKVGTVKILQLPVSIQTDGVVQPPNTFNDLPKTSRFLETRELSIQTDIKDEHNCHHEVCDAAVNTEDTSLMKEDHPVKNSYPRLPPDVYLNLDLENSVGQILPSVCEDEKKNKAVDEESPRMFISVADIGQDAVRRLIQEQAETLRNDNEEKKYFKPEAEVYMDGDIVPRTISPNVSLDTRSEVLKTEHAIHGSDPTTVDAFSSLDLHSSSMYPIASHVKSKKQAQDISKERLSQRLQEMNEQFDVIDQITTNMDRDLQRSNMLLRTIDNLNKVTDHDSSREKRSQDKVIRHDVLKDERKHIWQEPPWTNKPIQTLTELTDNADAETKKHDSNEAENDDGEDMEDIQGNEDNVDTEGETQREIKSNGYSRKSSISSIRSELRPSKDVKEIPAKTTDSNLSARSVASVPPQDIRILSEDKFKDFSITSTTSAVADARGRDRTPQKQQELKEWMTQKRKIHHKEWTAKLQQQRETEHKPFQSKTKSEQVMSSKKIKKIEKEREDIRRAQKKEYVDERLMSAYDLMNEMIAEPVPKAPIPIHDPTRSTKYKKSSKKTARVANDRYNDNRGGKQPKTKRTMRTRSNKQVNTHTGLSSLEMGSKNATVHDYEKEESGKRFITRKSYERYQNQKSENLSDDLGPGLSFGRNEEFNIKHSFDSRVDEILDDVSLGETIDDARLDHLDSLLSGDSELRELLCDVIVQPHRENPIGSDDAISINSRISLNSMPGNRSDKLKKERSMLGTYKVAPQHDHGEERRFSENKLQPNSLYETVNNWKDSDGLELSDEVAALLAEAKAAVGDDFSGTSEIGDIDWDEVDNVLQEN